MGRYAPQQALKTIRENLNNGRVILSTHFKERLVERRVSMQAVVGAILVTVLEKK